MPDLTLAPEPGADTGQVINIIIDAPPPGVTLHIHWETGQAPLAPVPEPDELETALARLQSSHAAAPGLGAVIDGLRQLGFTLIPWRPLSEHSQPQNYVRFVLGTGPAAVSGYVHPSHVKFPAQGSAALLRGLPGATAEGPGARFPIGDDGADALAAVRALVKARDEAERGSCAARADWRAANPQAGDDPGA